VAGKKTFLPSESPHSNPIGIYHNCIGLAVAIDVSKENPSAYAAVIRSCGPGFGALKQHPV